MSIAQSRSTLPCVLWPSCLRFSTSRPGSSPRRLVHTITIASTRTAIAPPSTSSLLSFSYGLPQPRRAFAAPKKKKASEKQLAESRDASSIVKLETLLNEPDVKMDVFYPFRDAKFSDLKPDDQYPPWIWTLNAPRPTIHQLVACDFDSMPLDLKQRLFALQRRAKIKANNQKMQDLFGKGR